MKHYICLDGNKIYYIFGKANVSGFVVKEAEMLVLPEDGKLDVLNEFVQKYKLNNKRVTLSLGSGLLFREFKLPKANSKLLRKMVKNELTYALGYEKEMAISFLPKEDRLLTYAIPKADLDKQLELLNKVGIHIEKVLVLSNCMGNMIEKQYPKKKIVLVVEVNDNQVRLQLIQNGYCLLTRNIRLNVKQFCDTKAYELLYEEVSDQLSKVIAFHASKNKKDAINEVVLISNYLDDCRPMAEFINKTLKIACSPIQWNIRCVDAKKEEMAINCYSAMATICHNFKNKKGNLDFLAEEKRDKRDYKKEIIESKIFVFTSILALNIALLLGVWLYYYKSNKENIETLNAIQAYIEKPDVIEKANLSETIENQAIQLQNSLKTMDQEKNVITTKKWLNKSDYYNLMEDFAEGMTIKELHFNDSLLEVVYYANSASDIADLFERVKERENYNILEYKKWVVEEDSFGEFRYKNSLFMAR